jgi:hypothetical protein
VDAAGAEWQDALVTIRTVAAATVSEFDPAADDVTLVESEITAIQSGLSTFDSTTDTVTLANDGITAAKLADDAITEIQSGLSTFDPTSDTVANVTTVQTVVNPVTTTGSGSGSVTYVYNITSSVTGLPIEGVTVNVSTDLAGANIVATGITDSFGNCTFYLDVGDYYFWSYKDGWEFTNPDLESVS